MTQVCFEPGNGLMRIARGEQGAPFVNTTEYAASLDFTRGGGNIQCYLGSNLPFIQPFLALANISVGPDPTNDIGAAPTSGIGATQIQIWHTQFYTNMRNAGIEKCIGLQGCTYTTSGDLYATVGSQGLYGTNFNAGYMVTTNNWLAARTEDGTISAVS